MILVNRLSRADPGLHRADLGRQTSLSSCAARPMKPQSMKRTLKTRHLDRLPTPREDDGTRSILIAVGERASSRTASCQDPERYTRRRSKLVGCTPCSLGILSRSFRGTADCASASRSRCRQQFRRPRHRMGHWMTLLGLSISPVG